MQYNELIEHLEEEIQSMEENHTDRWRADSYYSDEQIEEDKILIIQIACTINFLKDQMVDEMKNYK